jgi:hypothetical protein
MAARSVELSSVESAALTRLAIGFCLGRGSICTVTRSLCLQTYQPKALQDYANYQWRRLAAFLPKLAEPKLHEARSGKKLGPDDEPEEGACAQWRIRAYSRNFAVAQRLLYPNGTRVGVHLTGDCLSLLGAEAMAALWADRGRLVRVRGAGPLQGRLNLRRYSWGSAAVIQQWINSICGIGAIVARSSYNPTSPMLFMEHRDVCRFLGLLEGTWQAQAHCLQSRFVSTEIDQLKEELLNERLAAAGVPQFHGHTAPVNDVIPQLRVRTARTGRKAPTLPVTIPALAEKIA